MSVDFDLYLASSSPRRRELLTQIGVRYRLLSVEVDESPLPGEQAGDYVSRLAIDKARTGFQALPGLPVKPVMGADTAVVIDNHIMGKPANRQQAISMLMELSGRTHQVMSAVALVTPQRQQVMINCSKVTFRKLQQAECEDYWDSGEPADKAGAYAIQGKGAIFVSMLEGSYSGVMGLPLYETAELLHNAGVRILMNNNK